MATGSGKDKTFIINTAAYSFGGIGRDMGYSLWSNFLVLAILLTKNLNAGQFAIVSAIIIACRVLDAFLNPVMGSILESTRTKFGKFKPWIMIGAVGNSLVLLATFAVPLYGNDFIIFFPFAYILYSIFFVMNDIGYWSMLPALTSNCRDRNVLASFANFTSMIGIGFILFIVPVLTNGSSALGGNAVTAYKIIPACVLVLLIFCQTVTCIFVKERQPSLSVAEKRERFSFKRMFKVIFHNDQLMWISLSMFFYSIGGVVMTGISSYYIYFTYGYNGAILTVFTVMISVAGTSAILYPALSKRMTRREMAYLSAVVVALGYVGMLLTGLFWQHPKAYYLMAIFAAISTAGQNILFMIFTVSVSNTVEYNEYKTGKREEGIITSMRPFMTKLGSAAQMGVIAVVFGVLKVADITENISLTENAAAMGTITEAEKLATINAIIATVPKSTKQWLLISMTVIPLVLILAAIAVYLIKYKIDENKYEEILKSITEK